MFRSWPTAVALCTSGCSWCSSFVGIAVERLAQSLSQRSTVPTHLTADLPRPAVATLVNQKWNRADEMGSRRATCPLVAIFSIDAHARSLVGSWWGTTRNDPPDLGTDWDERGTNVQVSGMIRDRAGSHGMNLRSLPN